MENYESLGNLIGSLVGAVLCGICVYFTKSVWSSAIGVICYLLGGWIGKSINKTKVTKNK